MNSCTVMAVAFSLVACDSTAGKLPTRSAKPYTGETRRHRNETMTTPRVPSRDEPRQRDGGAARGVRRGALRRLRAHLLMGARCRSGPPAVIAGVVPTRAVDSLDFMDSRDRRGSARATGRRRHPGGRNVRGSKRVPDGGHRPVSSHDLAGGWLACIWSPPNRAHNTAAPPRANRAVHEAPSMKAI